MTEARSIRVHGVVQGVGFRPFVYRLAHERGLAGWVLNGSDGVEIHVEGASAVLETFVSDLRSEAPAAASIAEIMVRPVPPTGLTQFSIRESEQGSHPSVRVSPDLPVCEQCLKELFDPADRRYLYPYINCTNCGPRYSVITGLPYDRVKTTMMQWPLDDYCAFQYSDPLNRRFHAQPVACPECGPDYRLHENECPQGVGNQGIRRAIEILCAGGIVAVKGIGGYHLVCDGQNALAVSAMRERKFRKEKPFALMAKDLTVAQRFIRVSPETVLLLTSKARPITLAPAQKELPGVAPDNGELGVMLPYAPIHYLLFEAGAPELLVMTSANRSSEPIAYEDQDALARLAGLADAFLVGERPIARRVDDSVVKAGTFGPTVIRRSRGYAPAAVTSLPSEQPILALGADLKNAVTLVVEGQAFVSQFIGDLDQASAFRAFRKTIADLMEMYEVRWDDVVLVHDLHPQYFSTEHALTLKSSKRIAIQHHRAHVASVLAEQGLFETRVVGVSLDGTGFGDDGSIWGGEIFVGSILEGFERVAHLHTAVLSGGDAAARHPVQAAAGFLAQLDEVHDFALAPFHFPSLYRNALQLVDKQVRTFSTTSFGRLFDTVAALLGFTRPISFEGQAAIWLEQLARKSSIAGAYPFPYADHQLDFRPLINSVVKDRMCGVDVADIARAFQRGVAHGLWNAVECVLTGHGLDTVVLSGGVFQNELLLEDLKALLQGRSVQVLTNHVVPPNDGGISLGQAALAAFDCV